MASEPSSPPLLQPRPRRPNQNSASSLEASQPPATPPKPSLSRENSSATNPVFSRSRSVLNLTASTLFGIYAPTGGREDTAAPPTPWGTGAETPSRQASVDLGRGPVQPSSGNLDEDLAGLEARLLRTTGREDTGRKSDDTQTRQRPRLGGAKSLRTSLLHATSRSIVLLAFGLAYGGLIAHLHDHRHLSPVKVDAFDRSSRTYSAFWGVAAVVLGNLMPWIDSHWRFGESATTVPRKNSIGGVSKSVKWNNLVRSTGAFVGVAFAIRKLPWSSPLQLSLTLALTNPFLWYLLDRTSVGFTLSSLVGIVGSLVLFAVNPAIVPTFNPLTNSKNITTSGTLSSNHINPEKFDNLLSQESIGVATWVASVLFCSCVCFGNIGRLLVPDR